MSNNLLELGSSLEPTAPVMDKDTPDAVRRRIERAQKELDDTKRKDYALKLEHGITLLIRQRPLSGFILAKMRRVMDPYHTPTMGVRPTADKMIQLVYNPFFLETLKDDQLMAVLEHEVLHCINEHFIRRRAREPQRWNISCDMAINQYIEKLPPGCITVPKGLEAHREAEYYYQQEQVKKMSEQMGKGFCEDGTPRGDHTGWDSLDSDMETETIVREMVKQAIEEAKKYGRGNTPAWMEEMIKRLFQKPIRWQNLLRRTISEEISPEPEETFRKPHRRRIIEQTIREVGKILESREVFPGHKRQPSGKLYVAFDTSGSISSEDLSEFLNEISHLHRGGYRDITLIHCDAVVNKTEKYNGKNEICIHGRGGTRFRPALDWMMKQPMKEGVKNTLIYFTDGWGENPSDDGGESGYRSYSCKLHVIWVVTRSGDQRNCAQFGKFVKMEAHAKS